MMFVGKRVYMANKRLYFLILFFALSCVSVRAQTLSADDLLKMWSIGDTSQTRKAGEATLDIFAHPNKDNFLALVAELRKRDLDRRLRLRFYTYQFYGYRFFEIEDTVRSKDYGFKMLKEAAILEDEQLLSEMYIIYGGLCAPEEEIYYLLKAAEMLENHNVSAEYIYLHYGRLSLLTYEFMLDYKSSAKYTALAIAKYREPDMNLHNYILLLDIAGDSYIKLNMPDSAIYYYQMIRQKLTNFKMNPAKFSPKLTPDVLNLWDNIALGGIGRAYILREQYDTAYSLLQQNLRSSLALKEWADVSLVQSALGQIDYIRKDYVNAAKKYSLARQLATSSKKDILLINALEGGAKAFAAAGRYDSAFWYQKEYLLLKTNLEARKYQSKIQMVEAQVRYDGIQSVVAQTKYEITRQRTLRNIILFGVFLFGVIVLLIFNRNRLRYILKQTQLEKQTQLAESEAALVRKDMLFAQDQLAELVKHISEKNQLIEGLENRLAENERMDIHDALRNFTILTGNDWLKFKDYFDKAYPNYWERLQLKLPKLTQSDERLLALMKLQLGNKEIAAATGVSPESVRVSIHRLRKKIEVVYPDIPFEEFIATI